MTLSTGLIWALVILAPGLALHAALFRLRSNTGISSAAPPPGSAVALSIIGFGALVVHAAWAALSALYDAFLRRFRATPFEPNVYETFFAAGKRVAPAGADVAWALIVSLLLTLGSYYLGSRVSEGRWGRARLRDLKYGWLSDLVELAEVEGRFTTAFVLTTLEEGGTILGYEGLLENLAVNSDKEVTSVTLLDASPFKLKLQEGRREDVEATPIPRLYVPRSNIQNIAFNVFEYEDAAAEQPTP